MIAQTCFRSHTNRVIGNENNYTIKINPNDRLAALAQENDISKAVKLFRQHAGITQQQLALLANCSTHQITRIECGNLNEIRSNRYLMSVCNVIKQQTGIEINIQHLINCPAQSNNKTGILGVCYSTAKKRFIATITLHENHFFLGYFDALEPAVQTRLHAEEKAAEGIDALRAWVLQLKLTH